MLGAGATLRVVALHDAELAVERRQGDLRLFLFCQLQGEYSALRAHGGAYVAVKVAKALREVQVGLHHTAQPVLQHGGL